MGCAWRCGGEQALSRHAASTASSPLPRGRTCVEARRRADRRVLVACARGAAALLEGERERARRTHPACFFFPSLSALSLSHVPQRTNRLALEVRVHGAFVRQGREGGLGCVSPSCGRGERERAGGGRVERHTRTQAVRARPCGWVRKRHAGERDRSLCVSGDARACGHGRRENKQMEEREGAGAQLVLLLSLVLPAAAHSVRRDFWHTHPFCTPTHTQREQAHRPLKATLSTRRGTHPARHLPTEQATTKKP